MEMINVYSAWLGKILQDGIIIDETLFEQIGNIIFLNEKGIELSLLVQSKCTTITLDYIKGVIFSDIVLLETFSIINEIDLQEVEKIISEYIHESKIRYPWKFDNILYNKYFNKNYGSREKLEKEDVISLLESTPQGIYQRGEIIVGEFGVLHSEQKRNISYYKKMYLWHCSNPGCNKFHSVEVDINLRNKSIVIRNIKDVINERGYELKGSEKQYEKYFADFNSYDIFFTGQIHLFLGECFDEYEIRILFKELLINNQENLRNKFAACNKRLKGSAEEIASRLSKSECMHLILCLNDIKILNTLEKLIDEGHIIIPPTEKRETIFYDSGSANMYKNLVLQGSKFGIRVVNSRGSQDGLIKLEELVKTLYSSEEEIEDLNWKLGNIVSTNDEIKGYDNFYNSIVNEEIEDILRRIILSEITRTKQAFKYLKFGNFNLYGNHKPQDAMLEKIMWKLGFDIFSFQDEIKIFWDRYFKFYEECRNHEKYDERAREAIRSRSINFFVSLEDFLQRSLVFMCWTLLSDHYSNTRFKFCYEESKSIVYETLSNCNTCIEMGLTFDADAKDTLYPLIQGFNILAMHCQELVDKANEYLKEKNELPTDHDKGIESYPFLHKCLFLDLESKYKDKIVFELKKVTNEFTDINTCYIRNSTSHRREKDEFPDKDTLIKFCDNLKHIISHIETMGIYPLAYIGKRTTTDAYQREYREMVNYKGEVIKISSLKNKAYNSPSFYDIQILVPLFKLHASDNCIRFYLKEMSRYTNMKKDFPKRHI
jgi:hypothetical protein